MRSLGRPLAQKSQSVSTPSKQSMAIRQSGLTLAIHSRLTQPPVQPSAVSLAHWDVAAALVPVRKTAPINSQHLKRSMARAPSTLFLISMPPIFY